MPHVVAVIPARAGSKGIPNKNIQELAGRPLLSYSIAAARLAHSIEHIVVSTDSDEYARIAREYGADVPFLRPAAISRDSSTDYEFMRHLLDWFVARQQPVPEYVVHLRPTTPLREPRLIDEAVDRIRANSAATSLRSVHAMSESAYKTFEIVDNRLVTLCVQSPDLDAANQARQQFPVTYAANGYVDVLRGRDIVEHGRLHGCCVYPFITPPVVEVDTLADLTELRDQVARDPSLAMSLFPADG